MSAQRRLTAKRAWANLSEQARFGEKFGMMLAACLFFKAGAVNRDQVNEALKRWGITEQDRAQFRQRFKEQAA